MHNIRVERIIVVGVPNNFAGKTVKVRQAGKEWDAGVIRTKSNSAKASSLVIRDPKVCIGEDWEIHF
jgi:hypothetical protein